MKRLLLICLFLKATFAGAVSSCPETCQTDDISGVWYLTLGDETTGVITGVLAFFPDGIIRFAELNTVIPVSPENTAGSGAYGIWRKISAGVYQAVTIERLGLVLQVSDMCCENVPFGTVKNSWVFTVDPNDPNKLDIQIKFAIWDDPFALCNLEGDPIACIIGTGEACRLQFDNCPTDPGVYVGCASCISQAIREKYCSNCNVIEPCPPTPQ